MTSGCGSTDSDGIVRTIRQAVTVSAAPILPAANKRDEPRFIAPFPVIRLAGDFLSRGAFVRLLVVRAPRGALIRVRCRGDPLSGQGRAPQEHARECALCAVRAETAGGDPSRDLCSPAGEDRQVHALPGARRGASEARRPLPVPRGPAT